MKTTASILCLVILSACSTTPINTGSGWKPLAATSQYSVDIKNNGIELGRTSIEAVTRWNYKAQSDMTVTNTSGHSNGSALASGAYGVTALSGSTDSNARSVTSVEERPAHSRIYKVEVDKGDCLQGYGPMEIDPIAGEEDDREEEWAEGTNSAASRIADYLCTLAGWTKHP